MELLLVLGIGLFVGLVSLYKGVVSYRRRAMIVDIPRSNINSLAMGLVEIHGTVKGPSVGASLVTPFSKTECVYYSYKIEELRKSGKNSTTWVKIAGDVRETLFTAIDETGEVTVDPSEAEFSLEVHREYKFDSGFFGGMSNFLDRLTNWNPTSGEVIDSMPMEELKLVDSSGFNWYTTGDRRIREYCLELGEKIFLIGTAVSDPARNGEALICKGSNEPMFFIGDRSEKEMLNSLKWKIVMQLGGGTVIIVGCMYMLFR